MIDSTYSWKHHVDFICRKSKQSIYFLVASSHLGPHSKCSFCSSPPISVVCCSNVMPCCLAASHSLQNLAYDTWLKICLKIVGQPLDKPFEAAYLNNDTMQLAKNGISNLSHDPNNEYVLLPSRHQYCVPRYHRVRLKTVICASVNPETLSFLKITQNKWFLNEAVCVKW